MSNKLQALLNEIHTLEREVADELHRFEANVSFQVNRGKISFSNDILKFHRTFRKGLVKYLIESNFLFILSSPVIYSLIVPAVILDCFCCVYQAVCFPIYRIPKVDRKDYIRLDRHKLAYLNGIERLNCDFCAYFNGSLAFAREIGSRTEQYWCPIRHAFAIKGVHSRYNRFFIYGDAESYRLRLNNLRKEMQVDRGSVDV